MIQNLFIGTIRMTTYKHTSCILVRNRQNPQTTKGIRGYKCLQNNQTLRAHLKTEIIQLLSI